MACGSQSKFKLQQGQLLLWPLWAPVIFLCRGELFLCEGGKSQRETSEGERGHGVEPAQDRRVWSPEGELYFTWVEEFTLRGHIFSGIGSLSQVATSGWQPTKKRPSQLSWMRRNWRGSRGRNLKSCRPLEATLVLQDPSSSSLSKTLFARPASTLWSGSILYKKQACINPVC